MPYLLIKNRDKTIYAGDVDTISSYNKVGLFSVLLDHSNFISLIEKQVIIRTKDGREQQIALDNGLLKVRGNTINIYVGVK